MRLYNTLAGVVTIQPEADSCSFEVVTVLNADSIEEITKDHEHIAKVCQ